MKAGVPPPLDEASWPALLVDAAGLIRAGNASARSAFALSAGTDGPALASIWGLENSLSPEKFLAYSALSAAPPTSLRFQLATGKSQTYLVTACPFQANESQMHLLQLVPGVETIAANGETGSWQRQKLECALQLARTISLDFNNALTSILGHTSLVLSKMEPGHPWRRSLLEVEKSAAKAAEIANDLGTFSRQEKEVRAQASGNLNQVLQRTVEFFQQNPGPAAPKWNLHWERHLYAARFDEAKLQQAFVRILENAIEAIKDSGRITIQTRNLELAEPSQDREVKLAAGAYVCAEIADNGCGIEPDVLPRIFEPFFTTKRGGNHRGLGLAWVYGIVTNHGGGVAVSSQAGAGASVRVYLPAEKRVIRENLAASGDLNGSQTILMVDDEDLLLNMGQAILSAYGYRVLTANSGAKALEILSRAETPVDLVITDMVMPVMSGRELVEQILRLAPGLPILRTSGYVGPAPQPSDNTYLQKPFTSQELLMRIKETLAARREA